MKSFHMYLSFICTALAVPTAQAGLFDRQSGQYDATQTSFFQPVPDAQTVFRGQSEGGVPIPPNSGVMPNTTFSQPATGVMNGQVINGQVPMGTYGTPSLPQPSTWNAFSPPIGNDPFLADPAYGQVAPYAPYSPYESSGGIPPSGQPMPFSQFGTNGPQPYRIGWQHRLDVEWMPETAVSGKAGNFEQFGADYDLSYTAPFMPGWVLQWTNEFRYRNWDGPQGIPGLPGSAYRFGWDFELETPQAGPVNYSFGITPSLNTDFGGALSSTAFQLDGRALVIFTLDQYWSIVLGAAYWDRVNDEVIPYAGLIYRDDFWEWRIMYPETTISLFLGNEAQWSKWMYVRAEYHVEAYEVNTGAGGMDEVELSDYRILTGFKMNAGLYSWFIEAGYVFEREVDYGLAANGKFQPDSGFITRLGVRY